jgi:hypothetical protein
MFYIYGFEGEPTRNISVGLTINLSAPIELSSAVNAVELTVFVRCSENLPPARHIAILSQKRDLT